MTSYKTWYPDGNRTRVLCWVRMSIFLLGYIYVCNYCSQIKCIFVCYYNILAYLLYIIIYINAYYILAYLLYIIIYINVYYILAYLLYIIIYINVYYVYLFNYCSQINLVNTAPGSCVGRWSDIGACFQGGWFGWFILCKVDRPWLTMCILLIQIAWSSNRSNIWNDWRNIRPLDTML
jgi:hypothetical protein